MVRMFECASFFALYSHLAKAEEIEQPAQPLQPPQEPELPTLPAILGDTVPTEQEHPSPSSLSPSSPPLSSPFPNSIGKRPLEIEALPKYDPEDLQLEISDPEDEPRHWKRRKYRYQSPESPATHPEHSRIPSECSPPALSPS